jgi:TetR/AcrR family transcriptional repressor of lmrAB and yxaGH operons
MDNSTRQQIVSATSHLLETQGYHGTGLNQIIKESGAPRGSLYYYFPDGKEELAAAAIAQRGQEMAAFIGEALAAHDDAQAAILGFFDRAVEYVKGSDFCGGAPIAAVALETAGSSERLRAACADAYAALVRVFAAKLEAGGYAPERAHSLATLINAAIEGAMILSRAQHSAEPLALARAEIKALLECARPTA